MDEAKVEPLVPDEHGNISVSMDGAPQATLTPEAVKGMAHDLAAHIDAEAVKVYKSPVPQPTERTQVDKYGVRYRWWTDGSLRRA